MKGDSKAFQETLSGDALATYSVPANEAALKQKLSGLELSTGFEQEVSSQNLDGASWLVIYTVPVLANGAQILQKQAVALARSPGSSELQRRKQSDGRTPRRMPGHERVLQCFRNSVLSATST